MAGRPCNPNDDLMRLWQSLLPGTPFPQCGIPAGTGAADNDDAPETPSKKKQAADTKTMAPDRNV
jgi:hypothetical protein